MFTNGQPVNLYTICIYELRYAPCSYANRYVKVTQTLFIIEYSNKYLTFLQHHNLVVLTAYKNTHETSLLLQFVFVSIFPCSGNI